MLKALFQIAVISYISIMVYKYLSSPERDKGFHDDCIVAMVKKTEHKKPCPICSKKYKVLNNISFTIPPMDFLYEQNGTKNRNSFGKW